MKARERVINIELDRANERHEQGWGEKQRRRTIWRWLEGEGNNVEMDRGKGNTI